MPTPAVLVTCLNQVLPAIALSLWCAIYVVYCWRDQDTRRWFGRQLLLLSNAHRRPRVPARFAPSAFPTLSPPRAARPIRPPISIARPSGPAAVASVRVNEWQAASLPMRYRLLGQVRTASNDN